MEYNRILIIRDKKISDEIMNCLIDVHYPNNKQVIWITEDDVNSGKIVPNQHVSNHIFVSSSCLNAHFLPDYILLYKINLVELIHMNQHYSWNADTLTHVMREYNGSNQLLRIKMNTFKERKNPLLKFTIV